MANDFHRAARRFASLSGEIEREANDAISDSLSFTEQEAKANLSGNDTNWTRRTSQSIRKERIQRGGADRHVLRAGGSEAPHAKYVELGTGAFFDASDILAQVSPYGPPTFSERLVDNIYEWVQTKPVVPRHYSNQRDLAWAIAHTISELGTRSQPFFRPAWYATEPVLKQNLRDGVEDALRRV